MRILKVFAFLPMFFSVSGFAAALISYPLSPDKVVSGGDLQVPVHDEVEIQVDGKPQRLHLTGAGVRKKKVLIFTGDVYVAASYLNKAGGFTKQFGEGLDVIKKAQSRAMILTFLRDVKAGQMRDAFKDALKENGVDMEKPPAAIKELFEKLTFDLPKKSTLSIVSNSSDPAEDVVLFEGPTEKFTLRGPKLAVTLWSMWFGTPADDGLGDLKSELMGSVSPEP